MRFSRFGGVQSDQTKRIIIDCVLDEIPARADQGVVGESRLESIAMVVISRYWKPGDGQILQMSAKLSELRRITAVGQVSGQNNRIYRRSKSVQVIDCST